MLTDGFNAVKTGQPKFPVRTGFYGKQTVKQKKEKRNVKNRTRRADRRTGCVLK